LPITDANTDILALLKATVERHYSESFLQYVGHCQPPQPILWIFHRQSSACQGCEVQMW